MQHTIKLSENEDRKLREIARRSGQDVETLLRLVVLAFSQGGSEALARLLPVQSTPGVMGGDACIRDTRIPVWLLVQYKRQGLSDSELLAAYPGLNAADLAAAWDYFAAHTVEVEQQIRAHEDAV